jgi:hypothetical protein
VGGFATNPSFDYMDSNRGCIDSASKKIAARLAQSGDDSEFLGDYCHSLNEGKIMSRAGRSVMHPPKPRFHCVGRVR